MKTVKIILGDKEYRATPLRITEIAAANGVFGKLQKAATENDLETIAACLLEWAQIVSDSVRRADPRIAEDQVRKVSTPNDLLCAFKTLIAESCGKFDALKVN